MIENARYPNHCNSPHVAKRGKLYACYEAFEDATSGDSVVFFPKGLAAEGRHLCGLSLPHEIKPWPPNK